MSDVVDATEPAPPGAEPATPPAFRVMELTDVSLELPAQFPEVTVREKEPPFRQLTFPVGLYEGTNLALALQGTGAARPLSHEVLAEILARYQIDVVAVRLTGRHGGTYLAELSLMGSRGQEVVPCRPTDALNLALRMPVTPPVLCDERLLEEDGDVEPG